jgi:prepilin-type N-terminal cleavage/methylation domain-containing protein
VCRGFSLVELLAVVVIIMVLMALLMPLLKNAKLNGQRTVCLSNLGVLGKGFVQYPPNNDGNLMYTEAHLNNDACWVRNGSTADNIKQGALWPYVLDLRVYHCPAHPFQNFLRSYSWNDFINGGNYAGLPAPGKWSKIGQIPFPSRTMAQMDDIDPRGAGWLVGTWVIDAPPSHQIQVRRSGPVLARWRDEPQLHGRPRGILEVGGSANTLHGHRRQSQQHERILPNPLGQSRLVAPATGGQSRFPRRPALPPRDEAPRNFGLRLVRLGG